MTDKPLSTKDFYYDLPQHLIAQTPAPDRDGSRLMLLNRNTGAYEHRIFRDIIDYLQPGDVLVLNESKVIPARIYGKKIAENSTVAVEFLLLKQLEEDVWEVLLHPGRRLKPGAAVSFGEGILRADILETVEDGNRIVRFTYDRSVYRNLYEVLDEIGNMPLPPYITAKLEDKSRYQTVYAKHEGSAAAPTAGLHFTPELLDRIRAKGVHIVPVMLHVGLGTFRPVKAETISEHHMHSELCMISGETADILNATRARGGRIVCVGTTSCRTLESLVNEDGTFEAKSKWTEIFIFPGYEFKAMDALITNFHLPESTLVMLVSAFAGRENVLNAYQEAVKERYRFFSFGDSMYLG